jgi:hypothetical protein
MTGGRDGMGHTHLRSFMIRSMSSPTRSTNNRSLLLSASMMVGSASIGPSGLFSSSAGEGLDAGNGEETALSVGGRDDGGTDDIAGIVNGSAWGERVVVWEETRVASGGRGEGDGDSLEERTVTETVRVDVSVEERNEVSERGGNG